MEKKLILSQRQLDELTACVPYFDGASDLHGPNEVGTGEEMVDGGYGDPLQQTSDEFSKTITPQDAYMGIGRSHGRNALQVFEDNEALKNMNFTVGPENNKETLSYTNTTTILSRMKKLRKRIKRGDIKALKTYNEMGGDAKYNELNPKYDTAKASEANSKKVRKDILGQKNVYRKKQKTPTIKTENGVINYDNN